MNEHVSSTGDSCLRDQSDDSVLFLQSISEIPFEDHCVVIADSSLPHTLLQDLPDPILVQGGERIKTLSSLEELAQRVLLRRSTRPMILVAVGGGSIGDAVGFLASTLWRGVDLWQVPTTLLAAADSAHGGKTAMNLAGSKNQLGTFHPASRIFIVTDILSASPPRSRRDGLVEILKCLYLSPLPDLNLTVNDGAGPSSQYESMDSARLEELLSAPFHEIGEELLSLLRRSIRIKYDIVNQDPHERNGLRRLLNLGHTLGHALELTAGLSHGGAVAWGLLVALTLSRRYGFSEKDFAKGRALLFPLLPPILDLPEDDALALAMQRDKKRSSSVLHSIMLRAPGDPLITDDVSIEDWIREFRSCHRWFQSIHIHLRFTSYQPCTPILPAGKSELQRALVIAALRPGPTEIHGRSLADDPRLLLRALRGLGYSLTDSETGLATSGRTDAHLDSTNLIRLSLGLGAAPLRFLLAVAATRPGTTLISIPPALASRPHDELISAITMAGAQVTTLPGEAGYSVVGWQSPPTSFTVNCSRSSQHASALALTALVTKAPVTLRIEGDPVSRSYLDMTLDLLENCGMDVLRGERIIALNPTSRLSEPWLVTLPEDADARAFFEVLEYLHGSMPHPWSGDEPRGHPGRKMGEYLTILSSNAQHHSRLSISLQDAPDLLPLLVPAALLRSEGVVFTDLAHLRFKESNRLEGFAESLQQVGISAEVEGDKMIVNGESSRSIKTVPYFPVRGDHRMVMAAALLAKLRGPLELNDPWCITKSWPGFWDDAREAGWRTALSQ